MRKMLIVLIVLCFSTSAVALELAGVTIPDTLSADLQLNGAGIRSKFFFKIYIGALYLEHPSDNAEAVLEDTGAKQMVMHILYDEIDAEKLVEGWNDGFEANLGESELEELGPRIKQFNDFFVAVRSGDEILLDYQPEVGTVVTIAGKKQGTVSGADFNRALLSIWLGEHPVTDDLRQALLGKN